MFPKRPLSWRVKSRNYPVARKNCARQNWVGRGHCGSHGMPGRDGGGGSRISYTQLQIFLHRGVPGLAWMTRLQTVLGVLWETGQGPDFPRTTWGAESDEALCLGLNPGPALDFFLKIKRVMSQRLPGSMSPLRGPAGR